jgi:hypothetical protein
LIVWDRGISERQTTRTVTTTHEEPIKGTVTSNDAADIYGAEVEGTVTCTETHHVPTKLTQENSTAWIYKIQLAHEGQPAIWQPLAFPGYALRPHTRNTLDTALPPDSFLGLVHGRGGRGLAVVGLVGF